MLLFGSLVLLLSSAVVLTHQASTPESPFYTAGVVEFDPGWNWYHAMVNKEHNLEEYVQIIKSPQAEDVDIIVFPEWTLSYLNYSIVPDPIAPFVIPCDHADEYDEIIRSLSCVARDTQKYVVVNLPEKSECTEQSQSKLNDTRPCSSTGFNIYNANVVFNRQGAVISRYRKVHLYNEAWINTTMTPDISIFETDFNVTFGQFICFDMAFKTPAITLLTLGVRNIIFPTMWFSEAPFLTAVQLHQNWAYTNNVNLLAAGASSPSVGSTGTGIYNGVNGPLVSVMNFKPERKLYVAKVQKIPTKITMDSSNSSSTPVNSPAEMSDLYLKSDQLELSNHVKLDLTKNVTTAKLCYYDTCCNYDISLTILDDLNEIEGNGQFAYGYRLIAFDGVRTYDEFATGGTFICGIVACTDADNILSCGKRFNKTQEVVDAVQFDSIKVWGTFRGGDDILMLPNSLGSDIMPFQINDFIYKEVSNNGTTWRDILYELKTPKSNLLSFAIYGRNFAKDGQDISEPYSAGSILKMKIEWEWLLIIICAVNFLK